MSVNRKSALLNEIWILAISSLLLVGLFSKYTDGFKLKDLSAHEQEDGNKSPLKVQPLYSTGGKTAQFRKITKIVKIEDDDEEAENADNGEEIDIGPDPDYKFEKVRKAAVEPPQPIFKMIENEAEKEEDLVVDEAKETLSFSVLSFLQTFGIGDNGEGKESNALINWLKSFRRNQAPPEEPKKITKEPDESVYINLMNYLDRWPFNLIMQFDEVKDSDKEAYPEGLSSHKSSETPLSQQQFDYLLNRLPSFAINPDSIEEVECRKQLQIFARQLRGQKLWTLQMFDSTGKISSGILRGNINQFGDFDQCTQIKTVVKVSAEESVRIKGKYCLAHIDLEAVDSGLKLPVHQALGRGLLKSRFQNPSHFVPRYSTVNWGVCLPNACSANSVKKWLAADLRVFNASGVYFHIDVNEKDCHVRKNQTIMHLVMSNWKLSLALSFYGLFVLLAILGTITEYWSSVQAFLSRHAKNLLKTSKPKLETEVSADEQSDYQTGSPEWNDPIPEYSIAKLFREVILSFSFKRTWVRLIGSNGTKNEILAIKGLKVWATFSIYLFVKFLMLGHLPLTNRDKLVKLMSQPFSIVLRTPLMYLDTFLFVSGTVSSFRICQEHEEKAGISVMRRIVGRLIRSLPTLFAVLYFQTWILPHIGSGPLWSNLVSHNTKLCEQNMWRNFFTVQNAMNLEETCSPFTIQLAVDQQLYLLTPLIVWLYYSNPEAGLIVYSAIHAISVAVRFSRTTTDRLSPIVFHGMNVSQFYRTANYVYSSPLQRATAYVSGIGMGILLKSIKGSFQLSKIAFWTGSLTALWSIVWCFWYPSHSTNVDFIYEPSIMAPYASWAPLLLSFTLAWITFVTYTNNAPKFLYPILSSTVIHFLSKIAYPMQMVSYLVLIYSVGVTKELARFTISDLFNFQEIAIIITASTVIAMLFDFPMQNIRKILIEFEFPPEKLPIEAIKDIPMEHRLPWFDDTDTIKDRIDTSSSGSVGMRGNDEEDNEEEEEIEDVNENDEATEENLRSDVDEIPDRVKLNRFEHVNGTTEFKWNRFNEVPEEIWRTESDLHAHDSSSDSQNLEDLTDEARNEINDSPDAEDEHEEYEEEEEEDEEISESDEVIRRPPTSEQSFRYRSSGRWN